MAPSSKCSRSSSSTTYNIKIFAWEDATKCHETSLLQKAPIPKQGFTLRDNDFPFVDNVINSKGWKKFCAQPESTIIHVVCEFYANAFEHRNCRVKVRGKEVVFDNNTINKLCSLRYIPNDESSEFLSGTINYDAAIEFLCKPGTQRKISNNERISFKSSAMIREAKLWHLFVGAKMLPVTHLSDVTTETAIQLYVILKGKSIDVEALPIQTILHNVRSVTAGLYFSSLIPLFVARRVLVGTPRRSFCI